MKELSERAEREFEKWQEEYEIPLIEEFQVKTLLQLQEEYDNTEIGSHTTKTRESLLSMIRSLWGSLRIQKKTKIIYIDCNFREKINHVQIYLDDKLYFLENKSSLKDYASAITSIVSGNKTIIYMDTKGWSQALYDELIKYDNFYVKQLVVKNYK